jgi:hypothetical protein
MTGDVMRNILVLCAALVLSGCLLVPRTVQTSYNDDGMMTSVGGNMPPSDVVRTTEAMTSQQAVQMAIEGGVPVTVRDPYNGVPIVQVGGVMPYMYGYGGYSAQGMVPQGMTPGMMSEYYTVQRQLAVNPTAPPAGAPGFQTLPNMGIIHQRLDTIEYVVGSSVTFTD